MNCYRVTVLMTALLVWGCSRGVESKEAIRQGIIDHLANKSGLSVAAMQIDVVAVNFRQNEADAKVSFRPKGGGQGMEMSYTMERKGSRWVVKSRTESGSNPHSGGMTAMPPGGAGLPPGHPTMGQGGSAGTKK